MGQYNRLGQRRAGGAWQWLIIGFFPGLLCGGLVVFLLLLAGVFNTFNSEPEIIEITQPPVYIAVTATPDPDATQVVQVITATPAPTEEVAQGAIVQATLTPFEVNTPVVVNTEAPEASSTAIVLSAGGDNDGASSEATPEQTQADSQAVVSNIPAELVALFLAIWYGLKVVSSSTVQTS